MASADVTYHGAGTITKARRNDDGTVTFEASKAAGPDLDGDQQILDPAWLDKAMGDWFAGGAGGNLREQHGPTAAGKALTLEQPGNGDNWVSGIVVDPVSALKVEHDVLTGLSVGIKGARVVKDAAAPGGRIVAGKVVEVSLVDRPCNSTCKLIMAKADGSGNARFVEELHTDDAEQLAASMATLTARFSSVRKADDETADIAGARAALAAILPLLQSELDGLAAGELGEAFDVSLLTCAVNDLTNFLASEIVEQRQEMLMSAGGADALGPDQIRELVRAEIPDVAAIVKAELAAQQTTLVAELTKALKPEPVETIELEGAPILKAEDIAKTVSDAVAPAVAEAVTAALKPITDGLAAVTTKVDGIPVGGGPAITRTTQAPGGEQTSEKQELLTYAATPGLDPNIRERTLAKAAGLA